MRDRPRRGPPSSAGRTGIERFVTVNGHVIPWEEGMTVSRILEVMNYTFRMLVIKVDGRLIKRSEYAGTVVPAGSDVRVIHMVAGG